ncbi:OmpA family protein [Muricoccus radiodurans]|uniref:OmpA family protein n=1 Tax=Muricoccus radiodurans TaxID=2231721 RepID=UPI003CEC5D0F
MRALVPIASLAALLAGGAGPLPPAPAIEPAQGGWEGLSGRVTELEAAMAALGAREEGQEIVVDLPADILFDFDRHEIRPDAAGSLERLRRIIAAQPGGGRVRIEGHTDSVGSDAYNQRLSERRAGAVRAWLAARGVAGARMTALGFGEARPVAPNAHSDGRDDPEGRQRNRRVQVRIARG